MTKIFINPGHSLNGNPDKGCCYNDLIEANISYDIAVLLKSMLINNGFEVILYQQEGKNLTSNQQLNKVPKTANSSNSDVFISIHMNGFSNESAKGTETWYYRGSQKSQKLAGLVNKELTKSFTNYTLTNRGAKVDKRGLLVLKATNMPAVLTEIGFISNKTEAEFIKNNKKDIAQRLCNAICQYFNKTVQLNKVETPKKSLKFSIELNDDNLYDCKVNDKLVLSGNKLSSVLQWLKDKYGERQC